MLAEDLLSSVAALAGFDETPGDSRVAVGAGRDLTRIMVSVSATTGDLMLATRLGCDGYVVHDPVSPGARLHEGLALDRMTDLIEWHGVPRSIAEHAVGDLRRRVRLANHTPEWDLLASAADHLGLALLNVKLPADELARQAITGAIDHVPAEGSLGDVAGALESIPELARVGRAPLIVPDRPEEESGRVAVMVGTGVGISASVAVTLFEESFHRATVPVRTIVDIALGPEDAKRLETRAESGATGSVIVIGQMAADAIGMGRVADEAEASGIAVVRHGALRAGGDDPGGQPGRATGGGAVGLPSRTP